MLYISTDYVFDGEAAPYAHDAETNPVRERDLVLKRDW